MNTYVVRQVDEQGDVISDQHVEAMDNDAALRQLRNINEFTERIDVYNSEELRVGQISGEYWRSKYRRGQR